jgi:D-alanyl-D-alanine carboxypeptidase
MARRTRSTRRVVAATVLMVGSLLLSACTGPADAIPDRTEDIGTAFDSAITGRLDAALAEAMTLSGASGAIAGVWAPWAGQWVVSPGTTTVDGSTPLTTDMHFRIGDNTRSMTCTVLLKLVDEGTVKLSDPASQYLKRMSNIDGITLGQLCQNTSGVRDYTASLRPFFVNNPTRDWPPLEVLSNGLAADRLGEPGTTFAESRSGLVLLGMALEAATGEDWAALYERYIFGPLGLDSTSFPSADETTVPGPYPHGYAHSLTVAGERVCESLLDTTQLSPSMAWVAGGVVSTLPDLKVWAEALAGSRLVSKKSAQAQWATVPMGEGAPAWRSFGLGAQQLGPLRGDSGVIPGYLTTMLSDPESGLTVAVMLNNSDAGPGFVQALGQRLAFIASTAPAVNDKAPTAALPWTEEDMVAAMQATPVCPPPAPPAAPDAAAPEG